MPGVRDAAVALIAAASETAVVAALRLLLEDIAPAAAPTLAPAVRTLPTPRPAPSRPKTTAATPAVDEDWDRLRRQVRAAMAERGVSYGDVAAAVSRSEIAVRISLGSRRPPPQVVRTRLAAWLEQQQAQAVAAPIPFRGNGASRVHDADGAAERAAAD